MDCIQYESRLLKMKNNIKNAQELNNSSYLRTEKSKFSRDVYKESFLISLKYAVLGLIWIVISDLVLSVLLDFNKTYTIAQTIKGIIYVITTAALVFLLSLRRIQKLHQEIEKSENAYMELRKVHEEVVKLELELLYHKDLNECIILEAPVIIITWDDEGRILSCNPFGLRFIGYEQKDIEDGLTWGDIIKKERETLSLEMFERIRTTDQIITYEGPVISKDGKHKEVLWSSKTMKLQPGSTNNTYVSIGTDIEERKLYEEKIQYLAYYDSLTSLPNRAMFENEVVKYLAKPDNKFYIAYFDIDNFKNINDTLGHHVGDQFLRYLANCLKEEIKEPDYASRLGGDEFAILYNVNSEDEIQARLASIVRKISTPWTIQNIQFYITMSIGVVKYPENGENVSTLLKNADIAMYEAKKEGKNRIYYYSEEMKEHNAWLIKTINNLQYAIDQEQFTLVYQPQFILSTGNIMGMEALVRWIHPEDGVINPGVFIPLAEQSGLIYNLEKLVFRSALRQKALWEKQGYPELVLSINLSTKTLTSRTYFSELEDILDINSVDYTKIVVEVTETADITHEDRVISNLQALKRRGIRIALDDFGTGYSSLNYLKKFPIDIIKLDRSFINSITEEGVDTLLIKNILALAHDLQFEVIAEGIETEEQLTYLRKFYCEAGQGYLLSKPMPEESIKELLKNKYTEDI